MSNYVTPFLVLNLGSEMVFVVAQRLQAQHIAHERSMIVLDDIISVLISKQLMTDLIKPQSTYTHEQVREIIEDVTQSSAMRLDETSMGKLWDLITMVFKWQLTICDDIIKVTMRHLYEIETYVTNPETQLQLHRVQNIIDNFNKILSPTEKKTLWEDVQFWLKDFHVRVSLLLRMGLQNMDGKFMVDDLDPIAEEMLKNIGENIYAATQNGLVLENRPRKKSNADVNELQLFVDQILGDRKLSSGSTDSSILKLSISSDTANINNNNNNSNNDNENAKVIKPRLFDNIKVNVDNSLYNYMDDLNINDSNENESDFTDDLLDMLGKEDKE